MSDSLPRDDRKVGPSISRRMLLRSGTIGAAAVGAITAFPGVLGGLVSAAPEGSGVAADLSGDAAEAEGVLSSPIVAHISDLSTGQVALYVGEREVTVRDTQLVQRLLNAVR